jgi:predicted DNA-binding transcriptional regulator AlpA
VIQIDTDVRDELLDASQAFQMLGLPTSSGWALVARGAIPRGIKIGRRTRWSRRALEQWIQEQHAAAQAGPAAR